MEVKINHLKRYFGQTRAVDDISFSFSTGEIVAFIGSNGAGKTTTMRILATLDEPTDGDVELDGVSAVNHPERVRKLIGYMPDSLPTHRDMTVHEYLDFFARAYGIAGDKRAQTIDDVQSFTGLGDIRGNTLHSLSKGMKQRVSLGRALIHDPPVMVMDEPASGLDPRARIELRELLRILADQGKAILISSHILTELSEICGGAVIIEQGKIAAAGTVDEILSQHEAQTVLAVRPAGDLETARQALMLLPNVENVAVVGNELEARIAGGEEEASAILGELMQQGIQIAEFKRRGGDLESLFMQITGKEAEGEGE